MKGTKMFNGGAGSADRGDTPTKRQAGERLVLGVDVGSRSRGEVFYGYGRDLLFAVHAMVTRDP